jgi:hypothetical protein
MTSAIIPNKRPRIKPISIKLMIIIRILTAKGKELQRIRMPMRAIIPIPIAAFFASWSLGAIDSTRVSVRYR